MHSLRVAIGKAEIMDHDKPDNYVCAKCRQKFGNPMLAAKVPCPGKPC